MAQDKEKELQQLKNRFRDLADKSFQQGIFTFTGFLGLSEQDIFWREEPGLRYAGYCLNGGCESPDRVMVRFGKPEELGYEVPFPMVCIHITPLVQKFADPLSHRDFLGALMNLGIERSTIGDIKVGEKQAYLFCVESIAEFICDNLRQVKHTHVKCMVTEEFRELPQEEPVPVNIQVPSFRADAVLAKVYNISREKSLELSVRKGLCGRKALREQFPSAEGGGNGQRKGIREVYFDGRAQGNKKGKAVCRSGCVQVTIVCIRIQ